MQGRISIHEREPDILGGNPTMDSIPGSVINTSRLLEKLQSRAESAEARFRTHYPHAASFFDRIGVAPHELGTHAAKFVTSAAAAGTLVLASPVITSMPGKMIPKTAHVPAVKLQEQLLGKLRHLLPQGVGPLTPDQEKTIAGLFREAYGISTAAMLDGNHLNQTYGFIGAEQHLPRYPGDSVSHHDAYQRSGITPARGAFGYMADSRAALTPEQIAMEKYYVAVQTLYLPEWNTNWAELKEWYKFRKVLVVNTQNGKAVTAVIADAGPAAWTGKHFGGSPEVMAHLDLNTGKQKGAVVLFFIDEGSNRVALGPVDYNTGDALALNN